MKKLSYFSLLLIFISCSPKIGLHNVVSEYGEKRDLYLNKIKKVYFGHLLLHDTKICPQTELYWRHQNLQFYPIIVLKIDRPKKINWDKLKSTEIFDHLKVMKGSRHGALVSLKDTFCGTSYPYLYDSYSEIVTSIYCTEALVDLSKSELNKFEVIKKFQPDMIFTLIDAHFPLGLVKNNEIFFISNSVGKSYDLNEYKIYKWDDIVKNYEEIGQSWQYGIKKRALGIEK
jgi:hypothetical protein